MNIVKVSCLRELKEFLSRAKGSLSSFRYFEKRPLSAINKHLVTFLGYEGNFPVFYGHLDEEDGDVWLGICGIPGCTGKSLGKKMMQALLCEADSAGIPSVKLSVDKSNSIAISLYEKFGFQRIRSKENIFFYERMIPMDTLGGLIDKMSTVNLKMWNNQELLYELRRMTFDDFKKKYWETEDGAEKLWACLKKCCDLNVQRNSLIDEIDERIVSMIKDGLSGKDLDDGKHIQRKHKTY